MSEITVVGTIMVDVKILSEKTGKILLVFEFALLATTVVFAIVQGWENAILPLQTLVVFIILTIISLIIQSVYDDFEESEKQHPGTYHEIRT